MAKPGSALVAPKNTRVPLHPVATAAAIALFKACFFPFHCTGRNSNNAFPKGLASLDHGWCCCWCWTKPSSHASSLLLYRNLQYSNSSLIFTLLTPIRKSGSIPAPTNAALHRLRRSYRQIANRGSCDAWSR